MTLSLTPRSLNRFRNFLLVNWLLLASVMTGIGSPAGAVTVQSYQETGEAAQAEWIQQPDICTASDLSLYVSQVLNQGQATLFLSLVLGTNNICTGGYSYLDGTTYAVQFTGKATNSATLTGTISAYGCAFDGSGMLLSCADHTIDVNLNWSANGPAGRSQFINHTQGPGSMYLEHSVGSTAPADATGTMRQDGSLGLISGVSTFAYIFSSHYGTIMTTHP